MSVHAGSILHSSAGSILHRIQSAGLGDANIQVETIREVGNRLVVDKSPQEPDYTFSLESWNTSTQLMALLTGAPGDPNDPAAIPGESDPDGTAYRWEDAARFLNIASPWKDPNASPYGAIEAGHLIPGFFPTQISYSFGVTDNAVQRAELAGGSFYYSGHAPLEQLETGDGTEDEFTTSFPAIVHRKGGGASTDERFVFGVIVDGILQNEGVDYTVAQLGGGEARITFNIAPENGADVRFCYFTDEPQDYPQAVNATAQVIPGAVRGRNIKVYLGERARNERFTLTMTGTGGDFTLTRGASTTAAIAYNASASTIQTALEALANIDPGDVQVTGTGGSRTITFTGSLAGQAVTLSITDSTTGGSTTLTNTQDGSPGNRVRVGGIQNIELTATIEGEVERELGADEVTGRSVTGTDCNGTLAVRSRDADAFLALISRFTGVDATTEVVGFYNQEPIPLEIVIEDPRAAGTPLKTLVVDDAILQPPGTPAQVNSPTDFTIQYSSQNGTFTEYKGAPA